MCISEVYIYLLVRLCIAYTELMNCIIKSFNPLSLFVGVGDCTKCMVDSVPNKMNSISHGFYP